MVGANIFGQNLVLGNAARQQGAARQPKAVTMNQSVFSTVWASVIPLLMLAACGPGTGRTPEWQL